MVNKDMVSLSLLELCYFEKQTYCLDILTLVDIPVVRKGGIRQRKSGSAGDVYQDYPSSG